MKSFKFQRCQTSGRVPTCTFPPLWGGVRHAPHPPRLRLNFNGRIRIFSFLFFPLESRIPKTPLVPCFSFCASKHFFLAGVVVAFKICFFRGGLFASSYIIGIHSLIFPFGNSFRTPFFAFSPPHAIALYFFTGTPIPPRVQFFFFFSPKVPFSPLVPGF